MRQWLLKQRTKPKHVRDNIAFVFASGAAALVLAGWLILIPKEEIFKSNSVAESPEVFSTFFDQIKEQVAGVRGSVTNQASSTQATASSTGFNPSAPSEFASSTFSSYASTSQAAVMYIVPSASTTVSTSTP